MSNKAERTTSYRDYSWDDLRNEILSIVTLNQEQYILIDSKENLLTIIHFDATSDFGLRNSNTLKVSAQNKDGSVDLKFEAVNNLNRRLSATKAFNIDNSISQLIDFLDRSFNGELYVSKKYSSPQNEKLIEVENEITAKKNYVRLNMLASLILIGLSIILLGSVVASFVIPWAIWISVVLIVLFIILLIVAIGFGIGYYSAKTDIENLKARRNLISGLPINTEDKKEYFESLLQLNIQNLDSYYRMVKVHTAQSFRVSLMLSTIGILLITAGLVLGFGATGDKATIAYISSGAGILIEIVSSLLFYLYNKTVRQLKDYHDSLINAQNTFLSFRLIDPIPDGSEKVGLIIKMIDSLSKKSETNIIQ
jgi:ABC-type multidrug transport system fused ATPase/permease subunit